MSAGHRHGSERAASSLADQYHDSAAKLVAACTIDSSYDIPWLANRSRDGKTVYRDRRVPRILKCGIDTNLSLPWHELPEWEAENDGLPYDEGTPSAHCNVATPLERREVERQKSDDPDIWAKYSEEIDGYIREVDDESIERVPEDIDLRPFSEDDKKLLEEVIAAGAERAAIAKGRTMPQLLKPSDVATRLKAGEEAQAIFYDAGGARVAKAIGIEASVSAGDAERSVDFAISTGALDRYNSTIAVKGWQLTNFNKNPVVLWAHDDSIPAIGRGETTRIDGNRVRSRAIFADRDTHPLADTIYRLIKGKFINAASVGWIPLKWQFVEEEGRGFGIDYLEQELLEWSVVNIPANPECLVEARSVGIDTAPLITWAERTLDLGGLTAIPRAELEALRKAAGAPEVHRVKFDFLPSPEDLKAGLERRDHEMLRDGVSAVIKAAQAGLGAETAVEAVLELVGGHSRAGRVLSAENEKKLQTAHDHVRAANDHCAAAMDHVRAVIDQNYKAGDPDDDNEPTGDDPEQANAVAREQRGRRARMLRLRAAS